MNTFPYYRKVIISESNRVIICYYKTPMFSV